MPPNLHKFEHQLIKLKCCISDWEDKYQKNTSTVPNTFNVEYHNVLGTSTEHSAFAAFGFIKTLSKHAIEIYVNMIEVSDEGRAYIPVGLEA